MVNNIPFSFITITDIFNLVLFSDILFYLQERKALVRKLEDHYITRHLFFIGLLKAPWHRYVVYIWMAISPNITVFILA